jgi:hypothetical protein
MVFKTFYRQTSVRQGREIVSADVVIDIDIDTLAVLMGSDAINNKSGKATLCAGAIKVRATKAAEKAPAP